MPRVLISFLLLIFVVSTTPKVFGDARCGIAGRFPRPAAVAAVIDIGNLHDRIDIVKRVKDLMRHGNGFELAVREDLRDLIHDLRALSSAIYNSAIEARNEYDIGRPAIARDRIETRRKRCSRFA